MAKNGKMGKMGRSPKIPQNAKNGKIGDFTQIPQKWDFGDYDDEHTPQAQCEIFLEITPEESFYTLLLRVSILHFL